jgi:exodeoxyribonuclease V beta subunit
MLEQLTYPALASGDLEAARPVVLRELERAGLDGSLVDDVLMAFQHVVLSPLGGPLADFRLADLPEGSWLNEMAFDVPLAALEARGAERLVRSRGLAAAFREHPGGRFGESYAEALEGLAVASRGFLTGSIDLVFRCGERWWVADWKSNWLGRRDGQGQIQRCGPLDYSQEAMTHLMASHHYPLQAHLYLVALHRYLRWRLPGYQPERHLGGYAYLFLRGMPGPLSSEVETLRAGVPGAVVEQPPLQRLLALDRLLREGEP